MEGKNNMVEEKIYELTNGTNLILIEHVVFEGNRYLLLNNEKNDEIFVWYEDNKKIVHLSEEDSKYKNIIFEFLKKMEKKIK